MAKSTRRAAAAPVAISVTVTHKNTTREVLYRPDAPLSRLLADAVREHGLRFAQHSRMGFVGDGVTHHPGSTQTAAEAGITPGQALELV